MNTRTTLIMLLLAIALMVYFLVFESGQSPPTGPDSSSQGQGGKPLFTPQELPQEDVRLVRIEEAGEKPVVIERDASDTQKWSQTQPVRFPMQAYEISDLVRSVADLRFSSTFKPETKKQSLKQLGLEPPTVKLQLEGEGFPAKTLQLGRRTAGGLAYLIVGEVGKDPLDTLVYVVQDRLHKTLLEKKPKEWRARNFSGVEPGKAQRIFLQSLDQAAIEIFQRDGMWSFQAPTSGRADRKGTEALMGAVMAAQIDQFIQDLPENLALYGLDKPQITLAIEMTPPPAPAPEAAKPGNETDPKVTLQAQDLKAPIVHRLAIGSATDLAGGKFFAQWDDLPVVFTLNKADVDKLRKSPDDLRDPLLTPVARPDVRSLTLQRKDGTTLGFALAQTTWAFGEPTPGFGLDPDQISSLLLSLFETKAASYVALSEGAPKDPLATIKLEVLGKAEAEILTLHQQEDAEKLMVVRAGESTGYVVGRQTLALALETPLAFRMRKVLDLSESSIASITLVRTEPFPAQYKIERVAAPQAPKPAVEKDSAATAATAPGAPFGPWKLDGFDSERFQALIVSLTPLRAQRWVGPKEVSTGESIEIKLELADQTKHTLRIHAPTLLAMVEGLDSSFEVDQATADSAAAELLDRNILNLSVEQIASVKQGDLTLRRDRMGMFSLSGEVPVDEPVAAAIYDTLVALRADHYVDAARASGDPTGTLTVTSREMKIFTLKIWLPTEGNPIGQLDQKTFTLPRPDAEKLLAKPGKM